MHTRIQQARRHGGMTLIEVLVVLSIFSVLMYVIFGSVASFYQYNSYTIAQSYQVSHARRGVETLVRDVREMTYADDGSYPLVTMDEHQISFYSDIDRDDSVEYVEYELVDTDFIKRVYNATGAPPVYNLDTPDEVVTLSEYVQNGVPGQATSTFYYFDAHGAIATATSTVIDIRYVHTQIIVNIDPIRDPGEFMLRSSAALRNLKDNL